MTSVLIRGGDWDTDRGQPGRTQGEDAAVLAVVCPWDHRSGRGRLREVCSVSSFRGSVCGGQPRCPGLGEAAHHGEWQAEELFSAQGDWEAERGEGAEGGHFQDSPREPPPPATPTCPSQALQTGWTDQSAARTVPSLCL